MSVQYQSASMPGPPLISWLIIIQQLIILINSMPTEHTTLQTSGNIDEEQLPDYNADNTDYQANVRYDEYPMVVPKRTALMLDKMMVALQRALDDDATSTTVTQPEQMDLQRRGQQKGRVYLRCYFNAVTCFKKKK